MATTTDSAASPPVRFYSPVAPSRVEERPLADRLDGFARRDRSDVVRIGLLDNQKANAGHLLEAVGRGLTARHPGIELVTERKIATSPSPPEVMERLRSYDAVVLAIAD